MDHTAPTAPREAPTETNAWIRSGTALLAAVAVAVGLAGPAQAGPTATVKARTQRMSDANLNAQQRGWYSPGDKVDLTCSKHGEAVKGFFSFNIPNGGWDDLWYRTSDGSYVADVDIETGTLKDVTPECGSGAPAPAAGTDRGAHALAWARQQMASNPDNPVQCEVFVEEAYEHAFRYPSAIAGFDDLKAKGQIHTNTDNIPAGALVFTSDPRFDQGNGHVMLSEGNGNYLTANYYRDPKIREVPLNSNDAQDKFLGWAYAP